MTPSLWMKSLAVMATVCENVDCFEMLMFVDYSDG